MRNNFFGCLLGIVVAFNATSSQAGYISSLAQWQKLGDFGQNFYVMGLFDGQTDGRYEGEPGWVDVQRKAFVECAMRMHIEAPMLSAAVSRHYEGYPVDAGVPVNVVFNRVLRDMCLDFINARMTSAGLDQLQRSSGAITGALTP